MEVAGHMPFSDFARLQDFKTSTEPEDHDQTIHRVPVNGLIVLLKFYGYN